METTSVSKRTSSVRNIGLIGENKTLVSFKIYIYKGFSQAQVIIPNSFFCL